MVILFEEYSYNTLTLSKCLDEKYYFSVDSIKSKINYVGYYYDSNTCKDFGNSVMILPKVFINEQKLVFNEFAPEELIFPSSEVILRLQNKGLDKFLFEISTWLYRSIQQFNKRKKANTISEQNNIHQVISNIDNLGSTEIDIILSLLKFQKENSNLFTFIAKTSHSQLYKINWNKTVNKNQPIIQGNQPLYTNVSSNRKRINNEEELIILFFSTLNYLKNKYSFSFKSPPFYELITGIQFENLLRNGTRYLKSIKYKYYSDKLVELYKLLFVFFERSSNVKSKKSLTEILLIKDFNIIFEDMIDDLIGDTNLLPELKDHADGKQVDHIYKYNSLILNDSIYFVGDSKYYKSSTAIGLYSQAKQFTYAKNVIQHSIDLFNNDKLSIDLQYRDTLTEGYNITPNFFISAFVNDKLDYSKSYLKDSGETLQKFHFNNRLFDRDTLFVQTYNINFLFVMSAYISINTTLKQNFKKDTQKHFRNKLLNFIEKNYRIYKITPTNPQLEVFVSKYFKLLNGKIYKPSHFDNEILLAFEINSDYSNIIDTISVDCSVIQDFVLT